MFLQHQRWKDRLHMIPSIFSTSRDLLSSCGTGDIRAHFSQLMVHTLTHSWLVKHQRDGRNADEYSIVH